MIIAKPGFMVMNLSHENPLTLIEDAGRTCYKSEDKITSDSAPVFVQKIIERGHLSVIEHVSITVRIIIDRGVSHEVVRHRLASYSQESTRYANYSKNKFGNEITVIDIKPFLNGPESIEVWVNAMMDAEKHYLKLVELGNKAQIARSVLPNSLKTEIVWTCNLREWLEIFKQRTSIHAHPQMRELMRPMLKEFQERVPVIFDGININLE